MNKVLLIILVLLVFGAIANLTYEYVEDLDDTTNNYVAIDYSDVECKQLEDYGDLYSDIYYLGDVVTTVGWFNDTMNHSFTGEIWTKSYISDEVTVCVNSKAPGDCNSISFVRMIRNKVWIDENTPDCIKYEWVKIVDGEYNAKDYGNESCKLYTVDRMWLKPI